MTHKFCPVPWRHLAIRNNGDIRVCCHANTSADKGIFKKENGENFKASVDNIEEARNSALAKEIRLSMLANEPHSACIRCDREEINNIKSRRQYEAYNKGYIFTIDDAKNVTDIDGSISNAPLRDLDLRFGNLCNLKCRMCGATDSNQWYEDHLKIYGGSSFKDSHGVVKLTRNINGRLVTENQDYNWFESPSFWEQIESYLKEITYIHTVGGEPMLIEKHYDLLQRCIDLGYSKNITVEYNTNLTIIPHRALKIWPQFKSIKMGPSVDGIGKLNDYIRNPSNFDALVKNLRIVDTAPGDFSIWLACTVQIYNILNLTDLLRWVIVQNFNRIGKTIGHPIISSHPLHTPAHLSIKVMPPQGRILVRERFDEFYIWLENYVSTNDTPAALAHSYKEQTKNMLEGYYDLMVSEDNTALIPKFVNFTEILDKSRSERFEDACPELFNIIKNYV